MDILKLSKFYQKRPEAYQQYREKYSQQTAPYSLLSTEPFIFYVSRSLSAQGHASLQPIFDYLHDRTAYFFSKWMWDMENPDNVKTIRFMEDQHISQYPKHKFIHLCNTLQQTKIFQEHRLDAVFCNQNSLVDERIFQPISSISKKYDAVYNAKITAFKRHYLARKIDNSALLYYYNPATDFDCYKQVILQFAHSHFFNYDLSKHDSSKTYRLLSSSEVNQCLNMCRVGLCLSKVEGAMYASIQYLLSGLSIVSTQSKGGRDVFFDPEYVLVVEDNPDAVKAGVDEMIRRNIPPEVIRRKVLEKVKQHRLVLIKLIQNIYDQEGIEKDASVEWEQLFFNRLYTLQNPYKTVETLQLAKIGR